MACCLSSLSFGSNSNSLGEYFPDTLFNAPACTYNKHFIILSHCIWVFREDTGVHILQEHWFLTSCLVERSRHKMSGSSNCWWIWWHRKICSRNDFWNIRICTSGKILDNKTIKSTICKSTSLHRKEKKNHSYEHFNI